MPPIKGTEAAARPEAIPLGTTGISSRQAIFITSLICWAERFDRPYAPRESDESP